MSGWSPTPDLTPLHVSSAIPAESVKNSGNCDGTGLTHYDSRLTLAHNNVGDPYEFAAGLVHFRGNYRRRRPFHVPARILKQGCITRAGGDIHSHSMTSHDKNIQRNNRVRNPAEYPVLGILNLGNAHGYELCRRLREEIGPVWRLGKSQVYALLARMERDGLLVHERIGQHNLPARNMFSLTPKGRQVFREWLEAPVQQIRDFRLEFLTKLWFARQLGSECEKQLIERQLSVCREKVRTVQERRVSCSTSLERQSLIFRLSVIQAVVGWLNELLWEREGGLQ